MKKSKYHLLPFDAHSFANRKNPQGVYWLVLGLLAGLILMTGIAIATQTQERHQVYRQLHALKKEYNALKVEEQRLRIEQQTFSATSQVVRLSVDKLGMFFPTKQNRQVISLSPNEQGEDP